MKRCNRSAKKGRPSTNIVRAQWILASLKEGESVIVFQNTMKPHAWQPYSCRVEVINADRNMPFRYVMLERKYGEFDKALDLLKKSGCTETLVTGACW